MHNPTGIQRIWTPSLATPLLKADQNIINIQTVKTNKVSIMNRMHYIIKMETCIAVMGYMLLNNKDPNKQIMSKTIELINRGCWPPKMKSKLKVSSTAITARLFGRIKSPKNKYHSKTIVLKCIGPCISLKKRLYFYWTCFYHRQTTV